jgi:hypothetical protein
MTKPEHLILLVGGRARSRRGKAGVFPDLIARLSKRGCHHVGAGGEELLLLTLVCLAPPRGDDFDLGEAGAETLA